MEVSISGSGCRPTIASAMYGEADTIVKLTELVGGGNSKDLKEEFTKWREISRSLILDYHWDQDIQSFAVIPTVFDGDHDDGSDGSGDSNCDLSSVRTPNRTAQVRELLGFIPWYFESLIPQNRTSRYLPGFANGRIAASLLQLFLRPRRLLERSIVAVRDSQSFNRICQSSESRYFHNRSRQVGELLLSPSAVRSTAYQDVCRQRYCCAPG